MSIEQKLEQLTAAITALTAALGERAPVVVAQAVEVPATKPVEKVIEVPVAPVAPSMPPLPSFVAPVEPPAPAAPFSDPKGMIQYVTEVYKALGPVTGARIQEVILTLGVQHINEITAENYGKLYEGLEALKNGAR